MSEIDSYIMPGDEPYASPVNDLYAGASRGLLQPIEAIKLPGYPNFMAMTGGFRPFEFSILCGSTGSGKTTLCANISRELIRTGIPHFVASVETGHFDFIRRVMSALVQKDWNTGDPVPLAELKEFHAKNGHLFQSNTLQLSLYENRISIEILMSNIAWMVKHKGVKVAIIDNLNFFLEVTRAADQVIEMDRVIHELIIFCKKVNVHVIMVMHPKKTDSGRIENENDIKGSSSANQEAHNIFLWNRPHPELIKSGIARENDRELLIAKMRRKGKYVRRRLIFISGNGVSYDEGCIV